MGGAISTIGDVVGGAADAVGSAVGGAADAVGSVVGGIGDAVGSVADSLNPATIAAIVYFASTGDPSALFSSEGSAAAAEATLSNLGQTGYENILSQYGSTGELINSFQPVVDSSALYSSGLGSGSVLSGDLTGIVDSAITSTTNAAGGLGTAADTVGGYTFGADGSIIDAAGKTIADAATSAEFGKAGLGLGDIYNYLKNGLSIANLTGLISSGGSKLLGLMPSSTAVGQIFSNLGSLGPLAAAGGLGYLGYKNQSDINQTITDAYNNYLGKQTGIASAYGVGQGPQQLNYNVAGTPLAQAQPRTAAQTVVMPKAAKGGSINDLFDEYSKLNNRMRNYRRLAKGGLI